MTHPKLMPVLDLLRREVDAFNKSAASPGQADYARALLDLHHGLLGHEQAEILFTPGTIIRRQDGGHQVYGWHHILHLPDGARVRTKTDVSFHMFRWRARLAARSWLKRARAISERIAAELETSRQVEAHR